MHMGTYSIDIDTEDIFLKLIQDEDPKYRLLAKKDSRNV